MPKDVNTDAALNKLLFRAADETALIPRRVVVVDKDWFTTIGARNERVRRISDSFSSQARFVSPPRIF